MLKTFRDERLLLTHIVATCDAQPGCSVAQSADYPDVLSATPVDHDNIYELIVGRLGWKILHSTSNQFYLSCPGHTRSPAATYHALRRAEAQTSSSDERRMIQMQLQTERQKLSYAMYPNRQQMLTSTSTVNIPYVDSDGTWDHLAVRQWSTWSRLNDVPDNWLESYQRSRPSVLAENGKPRANTPQALKIVELPGQPVLSKPLGRGSQGRVRPYHCDREAGPFPGDPKTRRRVESVAIAV